MKKFLLSLSVAMLSFVGAWAQEMTTNTSDEEGAEVRRLEVVLSGDWLNGESAEKLEQRTTMLIDLIMGYEDGVFDADKAFTEVTIKSEEGSTVTVNQSLVQQLVSGKKIDTGWAYANNKIKRLDLSDVAVTHYVGHAGSATGNPNATFYAAESTCPIEYLAMPSFDENVLGQTYSIPPYTIAWMNNLLELDLPKNAKTLEQAAFADVDKLAYFHLNPGLEFIGNSAFWAKAAIPNSEQGIKGMEALDVPASVKYIGPGAFRFRNFTDLYFHSAQAPICPVGKSVCEVSDLEHPFILNGNYNGFGGQRTTEGDDYLHGYANRANYKNGEYWFTMVHFPNSTDCPNLDISSYKDDTRVYNKVYGNQYGNQESIKEKLQLGQPGMEQYFYNNEVVWGPSAGIDHVGKETSALQCPTGFSTSDIYENGKVAYVTTGYEDTYRGLNYIWPSRIQYNRALVTVTMGLNWDGVTKYRPELTQEQYDLMVKDGLTVKQNGNWVTIGNYTDESAAAYNATLPGAKHENDPKTYYGVDGEETAIEHNAGLPNAVKEGDFKGTYSPEEAYAENLKLDGAVKAGDERNPAEYYEADEAQEYNNSLPDAVQPGDNYYYSEEAIIENNSKLDGAKAEGSAIATEDKVLLTWEQFSNTTEWKNANHNWWGADHGEAEYNALLAQYKQGAQDMQWQYSGWPRTPYALTSDNVTFTADQAIAYNSTLPNAWNSTTVAGQYDEASANEHNNSLPDAVQTGDPKGPYTADEANQKNLELPDAIQPGDSKGTYSADEAIEFNSKLPGAVSDGDVKDRWTKADADAWNADNLEGVVTAGQSNTNDPELRDVLSKVAFQSTRRCVFSDNAGGGDHYDPKMTTKGWWTICVPFDLTKAQIDKYFGVGTHLCKFNDVKRKIDGLAENERPYVKFFFTSDQYVGKNADDVVLEAHTPYMIFPMGNGGTDAVQTVPSIPMTEYYKKTGNPEPTVVTANDGEVYRFIGNYDTKLPIVNPETGAVTTTDVVIPQYSYFYAKKKTETKYKFWFIQNNNMKWAANKCIIQSTSADRGLSDNDTFFSEIAKQNNGGEAKQITILGDEVDEDATAIDVIIVAGDGENSEVVYNLNGQMLNVAPQHGVYIKNGKKYIAK